MPNIAWLHPQVVHFAVALLIVGVLFRIIALTGRLAFTGPAATALIVLGTVAAMVSAQSGTDAHGPVERVPGARAAVEEHEEWGERARNVFVAVAALELITLMFSNRRPQTARVFGMGSAAIGVVGAGMLSLAAHYGGLLVYNHAGGVGLRSGNPEDVANLLVAGLYHQATLDRQAGKGPEAMALIDLAAARNPQDIEVQLVAIEWTTDVRQDPLAALRRLDQLVVPATDTRLRMRAGLARAGALAAQGQVDAARQVLLTLKGEFPASPQIQRRLDDLGRK